MASPNRQFKRLIRRARRNCQLRLFLMGLMARTSKYMDNPVIGIFRSIVLSLTQYLAGRHEKIDKQLDDFRLM